MTDEGEAMDWSVAQAMACWPKDWKWESDSLKSGNDEESGDSEAPATDRIDGPVVPPRPGRRETADRGDGES